MSKKLLIFTATLIIAFNISAQNVKKLEKELAHSEIVINGKDSLVRCQVLVSSKDFKPNVREGYYWHDNNKINVNIGSYSGKLLDGEYVVTKPGGELMTKGEFKNGQKNGKWMQWHSNGKVKTSCPWKKGKISGKMKEYDQEGNLLQITVFKNNMLHGTVIKYTKKSTIQMNYKKGVLIWEKTIHQAPKKRGMFQIM